MIEDREKLPCMDEKGIDEKTIYNYQQRLDPFKHYTKRKDEIDIRPLIKEQILTGTDWNTEQKKQQDFLGHWDPNNTPSNAIRTSKRSGQ